MSRLDKAELRTIVCKSSWKDRRLHIFTPSYYRREKLIRASHVIYGYAFKELQSGELAEVYYPVWVLHSPMSFFAEHPEEYSAILKKLQERKLQKGIKRDKIDILMHERYAEGMSVELPEDVTEGRLVFLSVIYVHTSVFPSFHLGLNLFLSNEGISKEILFLPPKYWTKEFGEAYRKEKQNG